MQKAKSYRNLILGCCMTGIAMFFAFFFLYHTYIQDIIYEERLNQMEEITRQMFQNLEDVIDSNWDRVTEECNYLRDANVQTTDELCRHMGRRLLAVFEPAGLTEESVKYWMDRFGKECVVVTSGNEWIDFIPFGTNKAKGIREYQKRYHISPEECIAFGDEYNDIEMLKAVKYGFAMEHSKEGVRAATSYMTKQVEPVLEKLIRAKGKIEEVI